MILKNRAKSVVFSVKTNKNLNVIYLFLDHYFIKEETKKNIFMTLECCFGLMIKRKRAQSYK